MFVISRADEDEIQRLTCTSELADAKAQCSRWVDEGFESKVYLVRECEDPSTAIKAVEKGTAEIIFQPERTETKEATELRNKQTSIRKLREKIAEIERDIGVSSGNSVYINSVEDRHDLIDWLMAYGVDYIDANDSSDDTLIEAYRSRTFSSTELNLSRILDRAEKLTLIPRWRDL
jgi:hypothetical protein